MAWRSEGVVTKSQGCELRGSGGPDPVIIVKQKIVSGPAAFMVGSRAFHLSVNETEAIELIADLQAHIGKLKELRR